MVFSSVTFLYAFLPVVCALHFALPRSWRNALLFCASLLAYAWGGPQYVPLLLGSITWNWFAGFRVAAATGKARQGWLFVGVAINLTPLLLLKYGTFTASMFGLRPLLPAAAAPIGISFYTFHAISYLVDLQRGKARPFSRWLDIGLYLAFFPQLIAGPIVRFREIADQIRGPRFARIAAGCERFTVGLAKKVLLADSLAAPADHVFSLPVSELSPATAWLGVLLYTLQIYFDFSGYSDMAVGLGHLFGFTLPENFAAPYSATSIREFWRRWHISLSTWFRDYVYIPLGGNRRGHARVGLNLVLVFVLCGLWHGASLTFLAWGLYHGLFLALERGAYGSFWKRLPPPIARSATLFLVMAGWVLFRSSSLTQAVGFWLAMAGIGARESYAGGLALVLSTQAELATAVGSAILLGDWTGWSFANWNPDRAPAFRALAHTALFALCLVFVASISYHPFLYFQF